MAALQGYLDIPMTPLVAATPKTVARLKTAPNQRVKILSYGFYFDGTQNSAQPVQITLGRITADGTWGSAPLPLPVEPELSETFQTSCALNYTAEPTYATAGPLKTFTVHPQLGYEYLAPQGQEDLINGGGMIGFQITAPQGVNVRGYVKFEE